MAKIKATKNCNECDTEISFSEYFNNNGLCNKCKKNKKKEE